MAPMWWKLIKIVLLLFALFTTIVCINSEISKRREAEALAAEPALATSMGANNNSIDLTAFLSDNLLNMMRNKKQDVAEDPQSPPRDQRSQQQPAELEVELPAEEIDDRVRAIFKVHDGDGVMIFNRTTTTDDASFMPSNHAISTMLGHDPPASESWPQSESQSPRKESSESQRPKFYHQYQSLNHQQQQQQQSFKVQRSPDGKLNLVFNDPLVSLQTTQQQRQPATGQSTTTPPRRPTISDNKYRPTTPPPTIDTGDHQCVDGFNQSRSFCTKVNNYPDLSGLKDVLARRFANFFSDEQQPTEVGLRINDDEQYLCNSHVRLLYPKSGLRVDSTWQYIVNTDDFKQGILIEECDNENESCQFLDSFPNNYVPVCKQRYVVRQLVTIKNPSSGKPEVTNEPFRIPSCCKCVIKSKFSVDSSSSNP